VHDGYGIDDRLAAHPPSGLVNNARYGAAGRYPPLPFILHPANPPKKKAAIRGFTLMNAFVQKGHYTPRFLS
jgi:hypothetical protein